MRPKPSVLVFATQYMITGGIESHLKEFCLQLKKAEVNIDLVVTNSAMSPQTEQFFRNVCHQVYLGKEANVLARFVWLSFVGLKLGTNHYDALYTNGQGKSVIFFSKLIPHRSRWIHHHHTAGDAIDQLNWGKIYWQTLQKATSVIACSTKNAHEMEAVLKRDIKSIPCFSREIKRDNKENWQGIRFGYYGRLIPEKGVDLLCRLSEDPDLIHIEFHLWGEGSQYPASYFKRYPKIKYHGAFNGTEGLTSVISSIDALLLFSTHSEGLPISLLEAMSAGLPWLATSQGGIPDIALDPNSMRIIPTDSDYTQTKKAVLAFAEDLKRGSVSGSTSQILYLEKFSSSVLSNQWQNILGIQPLVN